jgi:hypothetical protein
MVGSVLAGRALLLPGEFLGNRLSAGGVGMHDSFLKSVQVIEEEGLIQFDLDIT